MSASTSELSNFWSSIIALDSTLVERGIYRKNTINHHPQIVKFISHCCNYTFDILKCGESTCDICTAIRLPLDVFKNLRHIPHPTLGEDGHYLPFSEVFGSATTEEHRPSYKKPATTTSKRVKRKLPYYGSVQHVKNSQLMVQCTECYSSLWRLIFSKYKLQKEQRDYLRALLDDSMYSCGATLKELLPENFENVDVRDHDCFDPIEILYYSAKNDPICIYCGEEQPFTIDGQYPQCTNCEDKPPVFKRKM